ncbi:hypothetical protein ABC347_01465 [Sphingomonas sp. 1P06PA]|uniref:hypothetical protein n=1 Tax=Sphingomonas sp. 1P06PA TaxID=554121 RepID=UPI0039A49FF8
MALAALIMAYDTIDGGSEALRATLPVAGRTLVEHQARQAIAAGARHVILLVERIPAELVAAIDRLRHDGVQLEVARTMADAADRAHPDEGLLLFADGCLADQRLVERVASAASPAVLVLEDRAGRDRHERIDGSHRWAGLARLDGESVRRTAAMLGDWDAQSTLLRRAVQAGAARILADPEPTPLLASSAQAVDGYDRALVTASRRDAPGWPSHYLFALGEGPAAAALAARAVDPVLVAAGGAALAIAAPLAGLAGWVGSGLALALLSGPVAGIAARIGRLRLSPVRHARLIERVRIAGLAAGPLALAHWLAIDGQWGWWALAALLLGAGATLWQARRLQRSLPRWIADPDALAWLLAPFAVAGFWGEGMVAITAYAAVSAGDALRRLGRDRDLNAV